MSSSRRSSHSARSSRPIPWRTPQLPRSSAPVSVSHVFAHPEQGAPLATASQVIISIQLEAPSTHPDDNASVYSHRIARTKSNSSMQNAQTPIQEVAEVREVTPQPEPAVESEPPSERERATGTEQRPSSAPATANDTVVPYPGANSNFSTTSLPLPVPSVRISRAYWFESLTRAKGKKSRPKGKESPCPSKMSIVQHRQENEDLAPPNAIDPTGDVVTPTPLPVVPAHAINVAMILERPPHVPTSSSRSVTPLEKPGLDSCAQPSPTSALSNSTQQSEVTPHSSSNIPTLRFVSLTPPKAKSTSPPLAQDSLSPLIDEEVPVVDLSVTLPPPPVSVSTASEANFANLNASSSRFSFNIPFLGRSKMPLGNVSKLDEKDNTVDDLPVAQSAEAKTDSSLPQPVTIEGAAQDSLQNAIIHPSDPPSILAAEMETSKDKDIEPPLQQMSAAAAAEESTTRAARTQPPDSWWSYLGWSSSVPSIPVTSASPPESASMSSPPSPESDLRQSDSPSGIQEPQPGLQPLAQPCQSYEGLDAHIISMKDSTPSTSPGVPQSTNGHANEAREGAGVNSASSYGNDGYIASERDTLLRSLYTQECNSDETQQQLESAEQLSAVVSSSGGTPPTTSWFSPWSWHFHAPNQVSMDLFEAGNNGQGRMEGTGSSDPARVARDEGECRLPDETGADTDERKRTSMASNGENQNVVAGAGGGAQGGNLGQPNVDRGNAGNGTDTNAELTMSSESAINPIEQSITTHRSGWTSLFSSRRLIVKTLGYGSTLSVDTGEAKFDENGMEVMEVDFDEGATTTEGKRNEDQDQNQHLDRGTNGKLVEEYLKRKSTKTSQDGVVKPSQPPLTAPLLTTSEDIKKETTRPKPVNVKKGISTPSNPTSGTTTPVPRPLTPTGRISSTPSGPSVATTAAGGSRNRNHTASPAPSSKKAPPLPNIVLPTWDDTFYFPPRSVPPPSVAAAGGGGGSASTGGKLLEQAVGFVSGVLFSKGGTASGTDNKGEFGSEVRDGDLDDRKSSAAEKERKERFKQFGKELPRAWRIVERAPASLATSQIGDLSSRSSVCPAFWNRFERSTTGDKGKYKDGNLGSGGHEHAYDVLRGCKRVVVIGIHGWFPGAVVRTVLGEPTGTSGKFVNMTIQALENFQEEHGVLLEKITGIPLEGEGTIEHRVEKLYSNLSGNQEWMNDIHAADAIFVATHSQGSVVSTHLLDRLIRDQHIRTSKSSPSVGSPQDNARPSDIQPNKPQRVCCLALCGIHLGPLRYLSSSTFVQPYIQYFESSAARELFEFQNTESAVSKSYVSALQCVLDSGVKMVYVASLNDQVVPIYSGLFTAVSHPLILRALYIDGDAYHSSDFLSNLLVLLLRILNAGISDSGLLAHLSEATAGSLSGVGHSTVYEEISTYSLAVKYLFLTDDGFAEHPKATLEPFNATHEQNDYEIPWALRDIIADERVMHYFTKEIAGLRDAFRDWSPKTTILRDLKRKLQPIQRLPPTFSSRDSAYKL